jgi:hypothetical protein
MINYLKSTQVAPWCSQNISISDFLRGVFERMAARIAELRSAADVSVPCVRRGSRVESRLLRLTV